MHNQIPWARLIRLVSWLRVVCEPADRSHFNSGVSDSA
jgi:hypothetical protein